MRISIREILEACGGRLLSGNPEIFVSGVNIDSREIFPGDLFVPLKGAHIDAHTFIPEVFQKGAVASFTENPNETRGLESGSLIYVENTLAALQKTAAWYRAQFSIPVVGVTGSVGKTTTKEMIALALSAQYRVMYTKKNYNSQIGVPLTLFLLEPSHQVAVIEMGISEPGEMSRLAAIVRPTLAVMSNIGLSHIGQLGSKENILKEKLHMTDNWSGGNTLFLFGDDPLLASLDGVLPFQTVTYGSAPACAWQAAHIEKSGAGLTFAMIHNATQEAARIPVAGKHNVYNALAAIAIADRLGIAPADAVQALAQYSPPPMRQMIHNIKGIKIIDDTYNASPDSIHGCLALLRDLEISGNRIAVIADMRELGTHTQAAHEQVGDDIIAFDIDIFLAIGTDIQYAAAKTESAGVKTLRFTDNAAAADWLLQMLRPGDGVMVKGARSMHTNDIVERLLQNL